MRKTGHSHAGLRRRVGTDDAHRSTRRAFLIALGAGTLTTSLASLAQQQPLKLPRIGMLNGASRPYDEGFFSGLRELGYVEGKNILIERRYSGNDTAKLLANAKELVALKVDVIIAPSSTFVEAARQATREIPIVFSRHNDPVGNGHIASLARPGGNVTGLALMGTELTAKQLEFLRELLPRATRIAVIFNPTTPSHVPALKEIEQDARRLGLKLHQIAASLPEQIETAFDAAAKANDQALLLLTSPMAMAERGRIAGLALKHRLPSISGPREFAEGGGLLSYGASFSELSRRAASFVDRILKGANPATMAVEQPIVFEMVVNMKTAKSLGVKIPNSIMLRVDKVIE
jgi:ABC-type uncharacterized transport system substrate-binding protein